MATPIMASLDPIRYARVIETRANAEATAIREKLVVICGPSVLRDLDAVIRPRLMEMQIAVHGDPFDWGALERDMPQASPGPINAQDLNREALAAVSLGVTMLFAPLLAWWSEATDVPVGLETVWWIATSLIEIAEDSDVDDVEFAAVENHLRSLISRADQITAGNIRIVIDELAALDDLALYEVATETIEDIAQLLFPMGSTALLDRLLVR